MRRALTYVCVLGGAVLTGCAAQVHGDGQRLLTQPTAIGEASVHVSTLAERRFLTVVQQRYDFSCGSAALATLLRYHYGEPLNEENVFIGMWQDGDRAAIRRVGFSLLDMKRYLAARGLKADGFKVSLDQVQKAGVPGIALVNVGGYRHFVVVKGVQADRLLLGDPALGLRTVSRAEFQRMWNGIYFIINDRLGLAKSQWNGPRQWAAYVGAPIGNGFLQPVGLQALYLTAPAYGEF